MASLNHQERIGLLGGSFDPVHRAHTALALAACTHLNLNNVQLLPAAAPWQRQALAASGAQRLAMLRLACAESPALVPNPIELERAGPTYTIDTLELLPQDRAYTWIMGADQLENFCTWHRWRDILQHASLAVAQRPGSRLVVPAPLQSALESGQIQFLPFEPLPISASAVRGAIAQGQDTSGLLHPAVRDYIYEHRLYQNPPKS